MLKKLIASPSFIFLIAANLWCIWYYQNHPAGFATVVWIYWFQSIIIGLFNFADLLTIKNFDAGDMKLNNAPVTVATKGCLAFFFLVHYNGFHLGYAIFLLADFGVRSIDSSFLLIGVAAFLMESLWSYIKRKQVEQERQLSIGTLFFLPYLRVVPMHLMILIPKFTGIKASLIFLVLKMIADIFSFFLSAYLYGRSKPVTTAAL
jgi:hypothetical protein